MDCILVTGGLGFIGSHVCVVLLEAGYKVVILDNLENCDLAVHRKIEKLGKNAAILAIGDILDCYLLTRIFKQHKIDLVVHCAGRKAVGESVEKPLEYYQINVAGTINLLTEMTKAGVENLLFSSSATIYGQMTTTPFTETALLGPQNPYGQTKWMVEQILRDWVVSSHDKIQFRACALRYFNPVGGHSSGRMGENPKGKPNNLFPLIAEVAAGEREKLLILGDDYPTPDGTAIRDYIHVMDLAKGHLAAINMLLSEQGENFTAINLGSGKGYSVYEVLAAWNMVLGYKIPYAIEQRRAGDSAISYALCPKSKKDIKLASPI